MIFTILFEKLPVQILLPYKIISTRNLFICINITILTSCFFFYVDVELKPLSLSVKNVPLKQISYSDILNSLIRDANSAMCAAYLEPQTSSKTM